MYETLLVTGTVRGAPRGALDDVASVSMIATVAQPDKAGQSTDTFARLPGRPPQPFERCGADHVADWQQ